MILAQPGIPTRPVNVAPDEVPDVLAFYEWVGRTVARQTTNKTDVDSIDTIGRRWVAEQALDVDLVPAYRRALLDIPCRYLQKVRDHQRTNRERVCPEM